MIYGEFSVKTWVALTLKQTVLDHKWIAVHLNFYGHDSEHSHYTNEPDQVREPCPGSVKPASVNASLEELDWQIKSELWHLLSSCSNSVFPFGLKVSHEWIKADHYTFVLRFITTLTFSPNLRGEKEMYGWSCSGQSNQRKLEDLAYGAAVVL